MHIKMSLSAPRPWPHANLLNSCFRNSQLRKMAQRRKVNLAFCGRRERQVAAPPLPRKVSWVGVAANQRPLTNSRPRKQGLPYTSMGVGLGASLRGRRPGPGTGCTPAPDTRLPRLTLCGWGRTWRQGAKKTETLDGSAPVLCLLAGKARRGPPPPPGRQPPPGPHSHRLSPLSCRSDPHAGGPPHPFPRPPPACPEDAVLPYPTRPLTRTTSGQESARWKSSGTRDCKAWLLSTC